METDDFKSMMERIEKRKEILQERTMKRRNYLLDDSQLADLDLSESFDESSKRQCLSNKVDDSFNDCDNDKENEMSMEDEEEVFSTYPFQGLAALRKQKMPSDSSDADMACYDGDMQTERPILSTKSRLANLTSHIQDWEDESAKHLRVTPKKLPSSSKVVNIPIDNSPQQDLHKSAFEEIPRPLKKDSPVKRVTFCPEICPPIEESIVSESSMFEYSSMSERNTTFQDVAPKNSVAQKINIWDQAVLTTLESQGFVKSESKAKLSYEFAARHVSDSNIKYIDEESSSEDEEPCTQSNSKLNPQSPRNLESDTDVNTVSGATDPAELPLYARKALFENAFCGNHQKNVDNVVESNLSVAQRAALFEKAANGGPKKRVTPVKSSREVIPSYQSSSPMKNISPIEKNPFQVDKIMSPVKSTCSSTPKDVVFSPNNNVGSHVHTVQQHLIENSANDWKKNDIASKMSDERKNEISALRNHWEKVSMNSLNSLNDTTSDSYKKSSSSGSSEKFETVLHVNEGSTTEHPCFESEATDTEFESVYGDKEEEEEEEEVVSNSSVSTDEKNACRELDNILRSAVNEEVSLMSPPKLPSSSMYARGSTTSSSSSSSNNSNRSGGSTNSQGFVSVFTNASTDNSMELNSESQDNNMLKVGEENAPLLHTISFYRRQQQEKKVTPVRKIVRQPDVQSPPSPKKENIEIVAEKLKALKAEVLAQQTVISQTSQALNLCESTQEFSGSSEQVEAERLLLIATQKRIACLNEIQYLKSNPLAEDGCTGTLIINDLKLLLKKDFVSSQIKEMGSNVVQYFLCLIRYGHQVIVTQMLSAQESAKDGHMAFSNHVTLRNLPSNYSVAFEIYGLQTTKEKLSHNKKYHIKKDQNKLRLTKIKKGDSKLLSPGVSSPGGPNAVRTSSFSVVGFTRFTLENCDRQVLVLEKVPYSSPLEGVLELKMQLHAEHNVSEKGFLTMFEDVGGFGAWQRRWVVLKGKHIAFWKYPDDETKKCPVLIIDLGQCITKEIKLASRETCARLHTLQLVTVRPQEKNDKNTLITKSDNTLTSTKYLLSADSKEERILWCKRLNDALCNIRQWDPKAVHMINTMNDLSE